MLQIERAVNSAPKVGGVVALEDIFAAVGKGSIAQKKTKAAEFQILGMLRGSTPSDSCYDGFKTERLVFPVESYPED